MPTWQAGMHPEWEGPAQPPICLITTEVKVGRVVLESSLALVLCTAGAHRTAPLGKLATPKQWKKSVLGLTNPGCTASADRSTTNPLI